MDISIFIPVYKQSDQLTGLLDNLQNQNVTKEFFITVDEPTPEFTQKLQNIQTENTKIKINQKRIGKANALNDDAKQSTGKILLFLDSDIQITPDPDYLRKIIMETQHADILDIKKEVKKDKSFLSKMAYYEYLSFNISAYLSSRYMHKCPCVNGAAFAIKRETFEKIGGFHRVVSEDIDLAVRAFIQDSKFAYTADVQVNNIVFNTWKKWLIQRRRWGIGQALWFKDWYKELAKKLVRKPQIFLPSLFFMYPTIAILFLSAFMPNLWVYNSMLFCSLFLSVRFNIMLPLFLVSLTTANLLKVVVISLSGFAITAAVFYGFSRKLGFKQVKLHELFVYYIFYSTLWVTLLILDYIMVLGFKKKEGPDWKT